MVGVVAGWVEDGDAHQAAWVDWEARMSAWGRIHKIDGSFLQARFSLSFFVHILFGCHISPRNFIVGGASG